MSQDQFSGSAPPPPPDPSGGANVLAMQEAGTLGRVASAMARPAEIPSVLPASHKSMEERQAGKVKANPAESIEDARARMVAERGERLSLNAPSLNLAVPSIEGYHMHWFLETNVPLALRGWYEFVKPGEVEIPDKNIGGRPEGLETEELGGARVTQINKGPGADGRPIQFVLMKIRQEWYFDEQRKIAERNYSILVQIFRHKLPIKSPDELQLDYDKRYVREAVIDMSAGRFRKVDQQSA